MLKFGGKQASSSSHQAPSSSKDGQPPPEEMSFDDFEVLRAIGRGAFGKVGTGITGVILYRLCQKSQRMGCVIPHCNLQRGVGSRYLTYLYKKVEWPGCQVISQAVGAVNNAFTPRRL